MCFLYLVIESVVRDSQLRSFVAIGNDGVLLLVKTMTQKRYSQTE